MTTFIAIDFETATTRRDSACAVGLAACCGSRIVLSRTYLIRPPAARFTFTGLHGLDWDDVRDAPTFAELWPTLRAWIDDAAFVVAHNAAFDRSVLHALLCPLPAAGSADAVRLHRGHRPRAVGHPADEAARRLPATAHPA
ncbi:MAG: exonuclease domain-containing protein, partial [Spirochaetaceae bacterium]|nr:exonuclease domain-containing protein [Spirochaetaceae bacterium]